MLNVDIIPKQGILFVRLIGELNKKTVSELDEVNYIVKETGLRNIAFNVNYLNDLDFIGLNALYNNFKVCNNNNGISILCGINKNIKKNIFNSNIKDYAYLVKDEEYALELIERTI